MCKFLIRSVLVVALSACQPTQVQEVDEEQKVERVIALYRDKEHAKKCSAIMGQLKRGLKPGMTSAEASKALGDVTWLEEVHHYEITILGGWIPVDIGPQWAFCMHLYPNEDDWSNHVVYFSLSGSEGSGPLFTGSSDFTIADYLKGRVHDEAIKLHQFALCYPGNGHGSSDRIERFPPLAK